MHAYLVSVVSTNNLKYKYFVCLFRIKMNKHLLHTQANKIIDLTILLIITIKFNCF